METNFTKVINFNHSFGVIDSTQLKPDPEVLNTKPEMVEFCMKLIREECKELEQAIKDKDYTEMADALGDILYVVYGMGARTGIDMDQVFSLIHTNNMEKLCLSEEEAIQTVNHYKNNDLGYDSPKYRQAPDLKHWVVYNESTKKVLKSIKWKPVDLSSTLN